MQEMGRIVVGRASGDLKYGTWMLVVILLCWQHGCLSVAHSCYRIRCLRALLLAFPTTYLIYFNLSSVIMTPQTQANDSCNHAAFHPLVVWVCHTEVKFLYTNYRSLHSSHRLLKAGSKCKQQQQQQQSSWGSAVLTGVTQWVTSRFL